MSLPKCYFEYKTLTAKVGNIHKGYEILQCLQVPPFTKIVEERESLGNGWYGDRIQVEKTFDKYFIVVRDNKPIGVLYHPIENMKCDIMPLWYKYYPEVTEFISSIKINSI